MVLPLVDENAPKCYLCHKGFSNIEQLREHQKTEHTQSSEEQASTKREPAPGDVTIF